MTTKEEQIARVKAERERLAILHMHLEHLHTPIGVQQAINHLGIATVPENGALDEPTRAALRAFQEQHAIPQTGDPDEATQNVLRDLLLGA
jgi:hypothetical protein